VVQPGAELVEAVAGAAAVLPETHHPPTGRMGEDLEGDRLVTALEHLDETKRSMYHAALRCTSGTVKAKW
jgi:hypothetical protein